MLPREPIDCVVLRRSTNCMLSINALSVSDLSFHFDGSDIWAGSWGQRSKLRLPNVESIDAVRSMLSENPKSVFVIEIDPFGNDAATHDVAVG